MRHPLFRPWILIFFFSLAYSASPSYGTPTDEGGGLDGPPATTGTGTTAPAAAPTQQFCFIEPCMGKPLGNQTGSKTPTTPVTQKPGPPAPIDPVNGGVITPVTQNPSQPVTQTPSGSNQTTTDTPNSPGQTLSQGQGGTQGTAGTPGATVAVEQSLTPAQLQAMAPRLQSNLSQQSIENRLRPLMGQTPGPGDLPDSGAILASPISWAPGGPAPEAIRAAQPPPVQLAALLQQGNYPGAERLLTSLIIEQPDNWLAYRDRAVTRQYEKDYAGVVDDADQALKLNPKDTVSREFRASALVQLHRYPDAVDEAGRALEINPSDARALATRATAWRHLGHREDQLADLKKAAELDPAQFADIYKKALSQDADEEPSAAQRASSNSWLLYAGGAGGLLLLLAAAVLLLMKTGQTTAATTRTRTRPPMRLEDRLIAVRAPTLDGFEIIRKVGEGGMGIVYEAVDRTLRRKVALKQMREHISSDPRQRKRFLREASTVASLRHPSIVEIHSAFEEEGKLFLVFELVNGESLSARLDRGPLPPNETIAVLRQMARALDYAHAKGVIHQDLKPANIMVAAEGAKVMDFGIARRLHDTQPSMTTTTNEIMGTPYYMAPEQESGEPVKQSDLYALGVCAYEMLTGRRPFETTPCLFQKLESRFPPVSELNPRLPKKTDAVISKALNPKPAGRHANANEFVAELETALAV
jgi:tetratricopeptide (TPR) repeat protein